MKKQIRALLMFSSRQHHKLMQWKLKYLIPKKMKARWKMNHL
ncbi:exonuclease VIII [Escherichia coli]|nr:exonuclease VIII [Escherichia coli]